MKIGMVTFDDANFGILAPSSVQHEKTNSPKNVEIRFLEDFIFAF